MATALQKKVEEKILPRLLHELSFTDKEITVYLALAEHGNLSVPSLVRLTGINRTTIYSVADQLMDKGVVIEDVSRKKGGFMALPPEALMKVADRIEAEAKQMRGRAERLIIELNQLNKKSAYPIPKVALIPEDQIAEHMISQAPRLAEDALKHGGGAVWGFTDATYLQRYWDSVHEYLSNPKIKQIQINLIGERSDVENAMLESKHSHRKIRFWHEKFNFTCSMWVFGTIVIMVITQQRPYYLLEIHDEVLATNLRLVFSGIWESLPEPNKKPTT